MSYMPSARAKYNAQELDFGDFLIKNAAAIGKRLSTRKVRRITPLDAAREAEAVPPSLPGLAGAEDAANPEAYQTTAPEVRGTHDPSFRKAADEAIEMSEAFLRDRFELL